MFPTILAAAEGTVVIQGDMRASNIMPTFDHGYLVAHERAASVAF